MNQALVAICQSSHAHLNQVLEALAQQLMQSGIAFERHASVDALASSPGLPSLQVIAGFGGMRLGASHMDACPRLRGIVSCVSGTEGFDSQAATARGLLIGHSPTDENCRGMAESTVLLLLQLMLDLDAKREDLRLGRPRREPLKARLLWGKTVGLVGWGRISRKVTELLCTWGIRFLVYSRQAEGLNLPEGVARATLEEITARSDAVIVLAGADASAPPIITRQHLRAMRPGAYFINVSRGSTVDEVALAEVLKSGHLGGAALDVFVQEPLPMDSPLRGLDNVVLTPHRAGHTHEAT
jgi:D-3-phosphoglycerate dehydrogenase